jgi:protein phosphatase PTC1
MDKNDRGKFNQSNNINNLFSNWSESSLFSNEITITKNNSKDIDNTDKSSKFELINDYSYAEDKNSMYRNSMEDFCNIVENYDNDKMLFCLFDGHGGVDTVKYVKDRIPELLLKYLSSDTIEEAYTKCFNKIDNELKFFDSDNNGTTATIVLITKEENRKIAYCANVGDTKCLLIGKGYFKALSEDHKCTNEKEIERIKSVNGKITNGRVKGQLAITRTLGDLSLKNAGVISTPYVTKHIIESNDKFIIIASDGIWDVISDEEALKLSNDHVYADKFCKVLVKKALETGSKDNITCIVIKI